MSELEIELSIEDSRWQAQEPNIAALIERACSAALHRAGFSEAASISVLLADDTRIAALNQAFRQKTGPTNILSFPSVDMPMGEEPAVLGDLALAYQTITREAEAQGKLFNHHLQHLIVHGALHLLGYDHEVEDDATAMESLECAILAGLGIADPYAAMD